MRPLFLFLIVCAVSIVAGCEGPAPTTYPISGRPCSPDDPVHQMRPIDCVPPG